MMRLLTIILAVFFGFSSCSESSSTQAENEASTQFDDVVVVADSKTKLAVDGMMCEMGCVSAIQKELRSTPGVASATVNFEGNYAMVEFDSKLVDENQLIAAIEGIGDHAYSAKIFEEVSGKESFGELDEEELEPTN